MYTVLLTYGLNPFSGAKLQVNSSSQNPWILLATQLAQAGLEPFRSPQAKRLPRLQISLGTLIPEGAKSQSPLRTLTQLKFFIGIESESAEKSLPALPSGRQTGIQVYSHHQGSERYQAEVVRFQLGRKRRYRRRVS